MKTNLEKFKEFELNKKALSQVYGGGRWVFQQDGRLIWIDK